MIFDLLLKGGELPGAVGAVDIGIRDGLVMAIGRYLSSDKLCPVYDVRGKWVLPGLVDLWQNPGAGEASARAGVTLACVRTQSEPGVTLEDTLARAPRPLAVDYCFSYRVHHVPSAGELARGKAAGLAALVFTFVDLDDAQAAELLVRCAQAGLAVFFLPEHASYTRDSVRAGTLKRMGAPPLPTAEGEELMVARALALAAVTQSPLHLLGISTAASLRRVRAAKKSGAPVTASILPHSLLLHRGVYRWSRGLWYRPQPPLRERRDVQLLWRSLGSTLIALGSHARATGPLAIAMNDTPLPMAESAPRALLRRAQRSVTRKERADRPFAVRDKAFAGMAKRMCDAPAALLGFGGERSPSVIGCVADLAVFDPQTRELLGARRPKDASEWEPLVGLRGLPPPALVVRRGKVVMDDKGVRGEPGQLAIPIANR